MDNIEGNYVPLNLEDTVVEISRKIRKNTSLKYWNWQITYGSIGG